MARDGYARPPPNSTSTRDLFDLVIGVAAAGCTVLRSIKKLQDKRRHERESDESAKLQGHSRYRNPQCHHVRQEARESYIPRENDWKQRDKRHQYQSRVREAPASHGARHHSRDRPRSLVKDAVGSLGENPEYEYRSRPQNGEIRPSFKAPQVNRFHEREKAKPEAGPSFPVYSCPNAHRQYKERPQPWFPTKSPLPSSKPTNLGDARMRWGDDDGSHFWARNQPPPPPPLFSKTTNSKQHDTTRSRIQDPPMSFRNSMTDQKHFGQTSQSRSRGRQSVAAPGDGPVDKQYHRDRTKHEAREIPTYPKVASTNRKYERKQGSMASSKTRTYEAHNEIEAAERWRYPTSLDRRQRHNRGEPEEPKYDARRPVHEERRHRECVICAELQPLSDFSIVPITTGCDHPPQTCSSCIQEQIRSNMQCRNWSNISCPECNKSMSYQEVQRFADPETFARYERLSVQSVLDRDPNIVQCITGCGYAQYHASGSTQPIVNCGQCGARSCFAHRVAWHTGMTCEEYDEYLIDPTNFRPRIERDEEETRNQRIQQEEDDAKMAQRLAQTDHKQGCAETSKPKGSNGRGKVREKRHRGQSEAISRQKDKEAKARDAALKREQEAASLATIKNISKPCPSCERPIQKNEGCQHMTCSQCQHEFCWRCNATWGSSHNSGCNGSLY